MQYMTKMDRHREEARVVRSEGNVCPHGNAAGFSNYDVMFCGTCEREMADEAAEFHWESLTDEERAEIEERLAELEAHEAAQREVALSDDCPF